MKKKITETLKSSNIVPIVVALITTFGGWKVTEYRLTQLENKVSKLPSIEIIDLKFQNMDDRIKEFVENQKSINDTLLKMMDVTAAKEEKKILSYQMWQNYNLYSKKLKK